MTNFSIDVIPYTEPKARVLLHDHGDIALIRGEWRCTTCGHRLTVNGVPPTASRKLPLRTWHQEIIDRYRATHPR